jgi:hypothetical protein
MNLFHHRSRKQEGKEHLGRERRGGLVCKKKKSSKRKSKRYQAPTLTFTS